MRSTLLASLALVAVSSASLVALAPSADAASAKTPSKITSVKAGPGPHAGEITISWKQDGKNTTGYEIETGLTSFSKTSKSMPANGRDRHVFEIPAGRSSYTMSAAQVAAAGAAPATANHMYFRFYAVNTKGGGTAKKAYPYLEAAIPQAVAPKSGGTSLRVASFNVRTARATTDSRTWLRRAPDVARQIDAKAPDLVALQELGPGRADGKTGTTGGTARQTDSLMTALRSVGASQYRLTRTTPYVKAGTPHGTQGARILYNTRSYELLSNCSDKTGKSSYSSSCAIELPLASGDSKKLQRSAAFAEFKDKSTGKRFFFVSTHLDDRHSGKTSTEQKYNALRGNQMKAIYAKINRLNTRGEQVIVAGDMNSWQNNKIGNAPHDYLVSQGFYDTAAAQTKVNFAYSTINHFEKTQAPGAQGFGVRIDQILVQGATGAKKFENVTKVSDSSRPSDHNMIAVDLVL